MKGRKNHPASGSLEDRLRYVRMKHFRHMRETNPGTAEKKSLPKAPVKRIDLTHLDELTESQGTVQSMHLFNCFLHFKQLHSKPN